MKSHICLLNSLFGSLTSVLLLMHWFASWTANQSESSLADGNKSNRRRKVSARPKRHDGAVHTNLSRATRRSSTARHLSPKISSVCKDLNTRGFTSQNSQAAPFPLSQYRRKQFKLCNKSIWCIEHRTLEIRLFIIRFQCFAVTQNITSLRLTSGGPLIQTYASLALKAVKLLQLRTLVTVVLELNWLLDGQ